MKRGGAMTGLGLKPRTYGLKVTAESVALSAVKVCSALKNDEESEAFEALSCGEIG
jgi:hypothetical protein